MRRFVFALGTALLVTACGSEQSGTFETEDGGEGSYTLENDGKEFSATATTEDGTTTMRSGEDVPLDLPAGFTLYPGAKVLTNTSVTNADGAGSLVIMESADAAADLAAFYRKQAEDAGIKIEVEMTTSQGVTLAGQGAGDMNFSFSANSSASGPDGKTQGQLSLTEGM